MVSHLWWADWFGKQSLHAKKFQALGFFDVDLKQYEEINMNHIYYTSAAITIFITLVALISFVSITRLLIFHIKLGKYQFEGTKKKDSLLSIKYPSKKKKKT